MVSFKTVDTRGKSAKDTIKKYINELTEKKFYISNEEATEVILDVRVPKGQMPAWADEVINIGKKEGIIVRISEWTGN